MSEAQGEGSAFRPKRRRTVTMGGLIEENHRLKMSVHQLEAELAGYKARAFWPKLVKLVRGVK